MSKNNEKKKKRLEQIQSNIEAEKAIDKHISFNFEYFLHGNKYGQSFEEWYEDEILVELNNKLVDFSRNTRQELINMKSLEIYSCYPKGSKFAIPPGMTDKTVQWARLRLTGERRLIGVFFNNACYYSNKDVFYVVFLDEYHQFAPYNKK